MQDRRAQISSKDVADIIARELPRHQDATKILGDVVLELLNMSKCTLATSDAVGFHTQAPSVGDTHYSWLISRV